MKILFLCPYPSEGASNRLRIEQYFPYLESQNIKYLIRSFYSRKSYSILYDPGNYFKKALHVFIGGIYRILDVFLSLQYDVIFIHREAFPLGPPWIETMLFALKRKIIYDFDDAIFLENYSDANRIIGKFKQPKKTNKIIAMSSHVIVGNAHLKGHALRYCKNVTVIPTAIDCEIYKPYNRVNSKPKPLISIGWIGSVTSVKLLKEISNELAKIEEKYQNIEFIVIGGEVNLGSLQRVEFKKWSLKEEKRLLSQFDIGIMPMRNDLWAKGKCGFKAILYMSMGIPVVASDIGVNSEIIIDGENGFLARNSEEWVDKLSCLIENASLRQKLGIAGRKTVEEKFSVKVNAPKYLEIIRKVYDESYGKKMRETNFE